jgi:thiol-disulfide isomerase/thioredoxin
VSTVPTDKASWAGYDVRLLRSAPYASRDEIMLPSDISMHRRPASASRFRKTARWFGGLMLTSALALPHPTAEEQRFKPFKMQTLDGVRTSLAEVKGKATLIVFFFPTCGYCNLALPHIQGLHGVYSGQGLSTVWINVVPGEQRLLKEWRARHGYTVPILLGGPSVQDDYDLASTPTHYLVDAQGKVLWTHAGYTPGDEKILEREVRRALGLEH